MSAARRSSSTAHRTLLTAAAAGTLLTALWFVPSAEATQDGTEDATGQQALTSMNTDTTTETSTDAVTTSGTDAVTTSDSSRSTGPGTQLADTGSVNTTPYLVGGTVFLGLGAGFVAYSVRRERMALS
ncbi:LPXTG cell wall anchor domain-containing protein [Streptomyces acidicola]|uniref:LPXTG cell wall anchor domain-containing protein n=1 Tax=Streptomyces acidicola TaxID=2596892 RepID=UPI0034140465